MLRILTGTTQRTVGPDAVWGALLGEGQCAGKGVLCVAICKGPALLLSDRHHKIGVQEII